MQPWPHVRPPRVAICITGTFRTFVDPDVHWSLAENVSGALASNGAEVGHFYVMDSIGTTLREVLPGLEAVPPRVLRLDSPPLKAPDCLRTSWAHTANFVQWGQVMQCAALVLEDEEVTGKRWDWVVRTRADILFFNRLQPAQLYDPSFLYVPTVQEGQYFAPNVVMWGIRQILPILNEQFFLVPRGQLHSCLRAMGDWCPASIEVAHVAWTPFLEYTILWRLLREGVALRFLDLGDDEGVGFEVKRRGKSELDEHMLPGPKSPHQMHESRYRHVLALQPGAFGNASVGALEVSFSRGSGSSKEPLLWRDGEVVPRVVLEPGSTFRDHFTLRAVRACFRSRRGDSPVFLQVRVYRPVDPGHELWRLIGVSKNLGPAIGKRGSRCVRCSVNPPIVGAPGDALAYLARGDFALAGRPAAQPLRSGLGLAAVGEFDEFTPLQGATVGLAITAYFKHFDRVALNPHCFPAPEVTMSAEERKDVKQRGLRPNVNFLFSFDYCCDMEAQGPEGHSVCWNLQHPELFSYGRCCIVRSNFNVVPGSPSEVSLLDVAPLRCAVARTVIELKQQLAYFFQRLTKIAQISVDLFMESVFAPPKYPEDAPRPRHSLEKGDPRYLLAIFRYPRYICESILLTAVLKQAVCARAGLPAEHPADSGARAWSESMPAYLDTACAPFLLLHARFVATGLDAKNPEAFFRAASWL